MGELPFIIDRDLAKAQLLEAGSELVPVGKHLGRLINVQSVIEFQGTMSFFKVVGEVGLSKHHLQHLWFWH